MSILVFDKKHKGVYSVVVTKKQDVRAQSVSIEVVVLSKHLVLVSRLILLNINFGPESISPNVPIQDVMDCAAGVALCSLGRVCLVNEEKAGGGRGERVAQQRARHQLRNPGIKANLARMRKNNLLRLAT